MCWQDFEMYVSSSEDPSILVPWNYILSSWKTL